MLLRNVMVLLAGALMLAACGGRANQTPVYTGTLPVADPVAASVGDYRVGPFDTIEVTVFGVDDLSGTYRIDGSGRLVMPLIGPIEAAGLGSAELSERIAAAYGARYLRNPSVSVRLTELVSQRVTISGAVTEPQVVPIMGRLTLLQAVAQAKGVTPLADRSNVVVLRTIGGQRMAARFDLGLIESGEMADPELYAGDDVIVDTSRARQLIREVAPLGTVLGVFRLLVN